ncbi:MAG: alpha/beta fold hydrolase [Alicyclobacillus sp.]|nr:alpha/beta fold hydrolase [Alicyclobacillus sp.]
MSKGVCILIHGFTGTPQDLEPLATALRAQGYTVHCPLLAGHGGTREDLESATATAWVDSVGPLVRTALTQGPVHLVGFSMGAMIAAILAASYPIASVTMLAPAVFYVGTQKLFRQIAGVIKETWDAPRPSAYLKDRINRISQMPLSSVKQFRRVVLMGKAAIPKMVAPLCIVQGLLDETVEPRGANWVYQYAGSAEKSLYWLPASRHLICHGPEADRAAEMVCTFIRSHPAPLQDPGIPQENVNA